jgi:LPXTG-motif cell wall-anchored protein
VPPLADSGIRALSDVMVMPSAFGIEEFTITPAAARSAVPSQASTGTTAARAELANTGSDGAPLTAIALALIAAGGAAIRLSRRA